MSIKDENKFNPILVAVLWLVIIGGIMAIYNQISINYLWNQPEPSTSILLSGSENISTPTPSSIMSFHIIMQLINIIGCFLFLKRNKIGFYIIMATKIIIIGLLLTSIQYAATDILINLGQIILLLAIMAIPQNGKNAYQILWNKNK